MTHVLTVDKASCPEMLLRMLRDRENLASPRETTELGVKEKVPEMIQSTSARALTVHVPQTMPVLPRELLQGSPLLPGLVCGMLSVVAVEGAILHRELPSVDVL
jgi:hypothetical protein